MRKPANKSPKLLLKSASAHVTHAKGALTSGNCAAALTHLKKANQLHVRADYVQMKIYRRADQKYERQSDQVLDRIDSIDHRATLQCRRGTKRARDLERGWNTQGKGKR